MHASAMFTGKQFQLQHACRKVILFPVSFVSFFSGRNRKLKRGVVYTDNLLLDEVNEMGRFQDELQIPLEFLRNEIHGFLCRFPEMSSDQFEKRVLKFYPDQEGLWSPPRGKTRRAVERPK